MNKRFWLVLAGAAIALAQQSGDQKKKEGPPQEKQEKKEDRKPTPLFQGQLGIRSSQKTKESATLGFNGIDPSGKVDAKMMAASPGANEQNKVKQMDANRPSEADLSAFLQEGGLNKK